MSAGLESDSMWKWGRQSDRDRNLDELLQESHRLRTELGEMTADLGDWAEELRSEIERLKAEHDEQRIE